MTQRLSTMRPLLGNPSSSSLLPAREFLQGSGSACGSPTGARPVLISTPCSSFVHWIIQAATGPYPTPIQSPPLHSMYTHLTFFTQLAAIHSLSFGTSITTTTHNILSCPPYSPLIKAKSHNHICIPLLLPFWHNGYYVNCHLCLSHPNYNEYH